MALKPDYVINLGTISKHYPVPIVCVSLEILSAIKHLTLWQYVPGRDIEHLKVMDLGYVLPTSVTPRIKKKYIKIYVLVLSQQLNAMNPS